MLFRSCSKLTYHSAQGHFISSACLCGIVNSIATTFSQHARSSIKEEELAGPTLDGLLALFQIVTKDDVLPIVQTNITSALPDLFLFATVSSAIRSSDPIDARYTLAKDIFSQCLEGLDQDTRSHVLSTLRQRLQDVLSDCSVPIK